MNIYIRKNEQNEKNQRTLTPDKSLYLFRLRDNINHPPTGTDRTFSKFSSYPLVFYDLILGRFSIPVRAFLTVRTEEYEQEHMVDGYYAYPDKIF